MYGEGLEYISTICTIGTYQEKLGYQKTVIIPAISSPTAASQNIEGILLGLPVPTIYAFWNQNNGDTLTLIVRNEMLISGLNYIAGGFALTGLWNSNLNGLTFSQLDKYTQNAISNAAITVAMFGTTIIPNINQWVPQAVMTKVFGITN